MYWMHGYTPLHSSDSCRLRKMTQPAFFSAQFSCCAAFNVSGCCCPCQRSFTVLTQIHEAFRWRQANPWSQRRSHPQTAPRPSGWSVEVMGRLEQMSWRRSDARAPSLAIRQRASNNLQQRRSNPAAAPPVPSHRPDPPAPHTPTRTVVVTLMCLCMS